jgi:serine/threonine-protein kinase
MKKGIFKWLIHILMVIFGLFAAGILSILIMMVYTSSAKKVEVPYLIGETKNVGIQALKEKGLIPVVDGTGDIVLYTDPKAGVKVKAGHHVLIQLRSIDIQKVPDLIGVPLEVADQFLVQYKIAYTVQKIRTSDSTKHGIVLEMSPAVGEELNKNAIKLIIGVYEG